jgi:hypothetical protein
MTLKTEGTVDSIVSYLVSKSADHIVLIGPLISRMVDGSFPMIPYVTVCSGDERGQMHADQIMYHDEEGRADLIFALMEHRPIVVQLCDDELQLARMCEAVWPCEKSTSVRRAVEAERCQ